MTPSVRGAAVLRSATATAIVSLWTSGVRGDAYPYLSSRTVGRHGRLFPTIYGHIATSDKPHQSCGAFTHSSPHLFEMPRDRQALAGVAFQAGLDTGSKTRGPISL